jgi:hypothetical protein
MRHEQFGFPAPLIGTPTYQAEHGRCKLQFQISSPKPIAAYPPQCPMTDKESLVETSDKNSKIPDRGNNKNSMSLPVSVGAQ